MTPLNLAFGSQKVNTMCESKASHTHWKVVSQTLVRLTAIPPELPRYI